MISKSLFDVEQKNNIKKTWISHANRFFVNPNMVDTDVRNELDGIVEYLVAVDLFVEEVYFPLIRYSFCMDRYMLRAERGQLFVSIDFHQDNRYVP